MKPKDAIRLFQLKRQIPEAFRLATPSQTCHVSRVHAKGGRISELRLTLGGSHQGTTVSVSIKKYGTEAVALAVLHWITDRCGLSIRVGGKGSVRGTRPVAPHSGVGGIRFLAIDGALKTYVHVEALAPRPGDPRRTVQRSWSIEKWGPRTPWIAQSKPGAQVAAS